jgi:hypothetical protein
MSDLMSASDVPPTALATLPNSGRKLLYTICFDAPDSESNRFLTRVLVSSLLRTFFTGDIVVFRNSPNPLLLVERKGLEETYVDTPQIGGKEGAEAAWCWKYAGGPVPKSGRTSHIQHNYCRDTYSIEFVRHDVESVRHDL